ncbi:sensor histidine kinase [Cellulomonas pakistanensis]|uniref:Signal transduction histidine kinase subgroup 3 dimerisation and phosphoacceptor domain-containing protein n=1 Tax=Cellulomonas pakistanensis TaxID=992287 RepID=A0A919P5Q5_9CELL|nr:histidine kinase [Cellulomonas pakistanensis]GIG34829.1 hypothetical protein Cpa01nite_02100 [Cellulomonas pakistanensis]
MADPGRTSVTRGAVPGGVSPYAGGVRATWWYTVAGLVFLDLVVVVNWWVWLGQLPEHAVVPGGPALAAVGVVLQLAAAVVLVRDYPVVAHAGEDAPVDPLRRRRDVAALVVGAAGAALLGITTGSWMLGVGVLAFLLSLRPWPRGVRWRLVVVLTLVLVALWAVDAPRFGIDTAEAELATLPPTLILLLPAMSAFSLWWWDLVRELDRAREAAGALSAMRERLRLAGEVHDLQGHHLQVVALQLELAERLIERDPAAAAEQIRTARASVDEARAGTRDLATRFRGVPLPDEIANAADLLRAAGHEVQVQLGPGAEDAPADVLGPLVRESVTNVLKHGAGARARISLRRDGDRWRYAIANDRDERAATPGGPPGTGIAAIRDRIGALGGEVHVRRDDEFELTVAVPVGATGEGVRT